MQLSPLEWVTIITVLASGTLGAFGVGSYLHFRNRARLKRYEAHLNHHLNRLQRLTSKLLNALDQLFQGDSPEDTFLYQRFNAHGGEHYADLRAEVIEALQSGQQALQAAFDLHQKLIKPPMQQSRSLEQQIWDWEMLYATLIGGGSQTQNLTAEELRALLSPMLNSKRGSSDGQLAKQLNDLLRELAGRPLKVEWTMIHPSQVETRGIVDYVDRVKQQIACLPERHRQASSKWLTKIQTQRQLVEAEMPLYFLELFEYILRDFNTEKQPIEAKVFMLTKAQLFASIDERIAQILNSAQTQPLDVIEQALTIWQDFDTIKHFLQAMNSHGRRYAHITAITARGYRPPDLAAKLREVKTDLQAISQRVIEGDFSSATPWITELDTDSQQALNDTQTWQALHEQNLVHLTHFRQEISKATHWWQNDVQSAWHHLQSYARENWLDLAPDMDKAIPIFRQLQHQLNQIESLNSLDIQQFVDAERLLAYGLTDLTQVESQFRRVANRLAEVQAAEKYIAQTIPLAETDLNRARELRDREDRKTRPEIDQQIEAAQHQLAEAKQLLHDGLIMAAVEKQMAVRRLATAAFVAADEQVRQVNALQANLENLVEQAQTKTQQYFAEIRQLPVEAQSESTYQLDRQVQTELSGVQQIRIASLNLEDQALIQALEQAITHYEELIQLVEWATYQIKTDGQEYREALHRARTASEEARELTQQAKLVVDETDPGGAGHRALRRAQQALQSIETTEKPTRGALCRVHQLAEQASRYAKLAQNQARWKQKRLQSKYAHRRLRDQDDEELLSGGYSVYSTRLTD